MKNLIESVNAFGHTFSRYAATIIYCAALALWFTLMGADIVFDHKYVNNALTVYLATGVFLSFCIDLCRQGHPGGKRWLAISAGHTIILLNALYLLYIGHKGYGSAYNFDVAASIILCLALPFVVPFIGRKDDMRFWHFSRNFLISGALCGAVVAILIAGVLLLVSCIEMLFDVSLNSTIYVGIWAWLGCFALPLMMLMRTTLLHYLPAEKADDKFSVIVLRLFEVLLAVYFAVIYVYILKIVFTWELPKGQVVMPVSCMMALLLVVRFFSYGIDTDGKRIDSRFLRIVPWLALPALVLMSVGIGRRIADYGMTAPRFYALLLNVWSYAICAYMILRKRILPILASLAAVAFAVSYGPTSAWRLFPKEDKEISEVVAPEQEAPRSLGTIVLHPHEELPDDLRPVDFTTIFLAGTIDMGNSRDWQVELAEYFASKDGNYLLFNPRQEHWDPTREGEMDYQVNWELDHLERADMIIMNFLPGSQSPITLLELGLHARRAGKLFVCCPKEFYRYDNVRITCEKYGVPVFEDIESLLEVI